MMRFSIIWNTLRSTWFELFLPHRKHWVLFTTTITAKRRDERTNLLLLNHPCKAFQFREEWILPMRTPPGHKLKVLFLSILSKYGHSYVAGAQLWFFLDRGGFTKHGATRLVILRRTHYSWVRLWKFWILDVPDRFKMQFQWACVWACCNEYLYPNLGPNLVNLGYDSGSKKFGQGRLRPCVNKQSKQA